MGRSYMRRQLVLPAILSVAVAMVGMPSISNAGIFEFTVTGVWGSGNPANVNSALGAPFEWVFWYDTGEVPTASGPGDGANVPPEMQYQYVSGGNTKTISFDSNTLDASPTTEFAHTAAAAWRNQLTNDLTMFGGGPIPPTDLGSLIDSLVVSGSPMDIRADTPLIPGYQNTAITAALTNPDESGLNTILTQGGPGQTVSITGFGLGQDPAGLITGVSYMMVPEPSTLALALFAGPLFIWAFRRRRRGQ